MSVILKDESDPDGLYKLFIKGADNIIIDRLKKSDIYNKDDPSSV